MKQPVVFNTETVSFWSGTWVSDSHIKMENDLDFTF